MKIQGSKEQIAYGIIAVICFLCFYGFTFHDVWQEQEKNGIDIVMLGDSIPGQVRDTTSVPALLQQLTGRPVFNGALGRTSMGWTGA